MNFSIRFTRAAVKSVLASPWAKQKNSPSQTGWGWELQTSDLVAGRLARPALAQQGRQAGQFLLGQAVQVREV